MAKKTKSQKKINKKSPPAASWRWELVHKSMTKEGLKQSFHSNLHYNLAKDLFTTTSRDNYMALAMAVRERIVERWIVTQQNYHKKNKKRVYYLSLEFLIGRLLGNNLINLDLMDQAHEAIEEMGLDLQAIRDEEHDAGLGNGGLGRLAACFLDSMASLGIPAHGYGIRYEYGIFEQKILNGYQVEMPDEWLRLGNPWEFERPEYAVPVKFYGEVHNFYDKNGKLCVEWRNTQDVIAMPYDIPVVGYQNDVVNTLRLWSAKSSEDFDLEFFNDGDYEKAVYMKMFSENISKVLYPNDANAMGRELRLKQEYFFTAASMADIRRRFKSENSDCRDFPNKATIQLNDTHPSLAVVEFLRVLIDEEHLEWEEAWEITVKTFAYTNHTVMPEALETWSVVLFERLLPRHLQLIYEINARFLKLIQSRFPGDEDRLRRMSLIEDGETKRVRMAHLAIVGSHSVNGVSELHTTLLTTQLFKDFFELWPKKFNNKTNGISQRRWLLKSNPDLSGLITEAIGEKWIHDLSKLKGLERFVKDASFKEKWQKIKIQNKKRLANHIEKTMGIKVSLESLFDAQVKRIHEYKRQSLFAFYILSEYLKLKENPKSVRVPRTFLVSGKAAPGYAMAKLVIKLITSISDVINHDPEVKGRLKVLFLENYRVSLAEMIFPASDLSEQISTAGLEASGTGCMKFMMNGALTIGTLDGANIEMADEVGKKNMFTFGLHADQVLDLKRKGYHPNHFIASSPMLQKIFNLLRSADFLSPEIVAVLNPLITNLVESDPFLVCADFEAYLKTQKAVSEAYLDQDSWTQTAILNVARSSKFSSDRTIQEYANDVWKVPYRS